MKTKKTYTKQRILQHAEKFNYTVLTAFKKEDYPEKSMISVRHSCGRKVPIKIRNFFKHVCICRKPAKIKEICILCENPNMVKSELCDSCQKQKVEIGITVGQLIFIKNKYQEKNVFSFIHQNPSILNDTSYRSKPSLLTRKKIREHYRSSAYQSEQYEKWIDVIPLYIQELFIGLPAYQFLTLSGDKLNPNVHYICKACNIEQCQTYKCLLRKKSHNCTISLSSGESAVLGFLASHVDTLTQYDTLKCINPLTKRQLPYDIEIVGHKLLIEIQGPQHFEFTEWFHGTIDNFEYQQYRDKIKKEYADKMGYRLLYLTYNHFNDLTYQRLLLLELSKEGYESKDHQLDGSYLSDTQLLNM